MSALPNEIFSNITNFLPNDDITDLMLMSRNFNALVTLRLKKINQDMTTMNQSIKSFMPSPAPEATNVSDEWISQLNLKRFEPVGSKAKERMNEYFKTFFEYPAHVFQYPAILLLDMSLDSRDTSSIVSLKKAMSLERFDNASFFVILSAFVATPEFRQEHNISDYYNYKLMWVRQMICKYWQRNN